MFDHTTLCYFINYRNNNILWRFYSIKIFNSAIWWPCSIHIYSIYYIIYFTGANPFAFFHSLVFNYIVIFMSNLRIEIIIHGLIYTVYTSPRPKKRPKSIPLVNLKKMLLIFLQHYLASLAT